MYKKYIFLLGLLLPLSLFAQNFSKGSVVDENKTPLIGADVGKVPK